MQAGRRPASRAALYLTSAGVRFLIMLLMRVSSDGCVDRNSGGLSRLVYHNLHDYLRRVSKDVVIGEATRMDKPMDSYFLISRR